MEEEYGDEFLDDFGPAAKAKKLKKRKKKKKNKKELTPLEKMRDERLARKAAAAFMKTSPAGGQGVANTLFGGVLKSKLASAREKLQILPGTQIHCRHIGVEGWDGTDDGCGTYEDEERLCELFSPFGKVLQATVRHRIQDPNNSGRAEKTKGPRANTSWALVTMLDTESADRAIQVGVTAGSTELKLTRFNQALADSSTGGMVAVQQAARLAAKKLASVRIAEARKQALAKIATTKATDTTSQSDLVAPSEGIPPGESTLEARATNAQAAGIDGTASENAAALILKLEQDRDNLMTVAIEEIYDLERKLAAYKAAVGTVAEAKLLKEQVQRRNEARAAVPEGDKGQIIDRSERESYGNIIPEHHSGTMPSNIPNVAATTARDQAPTEVLDRVEALSSDSDDSVSSSDSDG